MAQVRNVSGGPPRLICVRMRDGSYQSREVSGPISQWDSSLTASSPLPSRSSSNSSISTIRAKTGPSSFPPSPAISSSSTCVASPRTTALQESFDKYTLGFPELARRLAALHYHLTLRLLENHHVCQICNAHPANTKPAAQEIHVQRLQEQLDCAQCDLLPRDGLYDHYIRERCFMYVEDDGLIPNCAHKCSMGREPTQNHYLHILEHVQKVRAIWIGHHATARINLFVESNNGKTCKYVSCDEEVLLESSNYFKDNIDEIRRSWRLGFDGLGIFLDWQKSGQIDTRGISLERLLIRTKWARSLRFTQHILHHMFAKYSTQGVTTAEVRELWMGSRNVPWIRQLVWDIIVYKMRYICFHPSTEALSTWSIWHDSWGPGYWELRYRCAASVQQVIPQPYQFDCPVCHGDSRKCELRKTWVVSGTPPWHYRRKHETLSRVEIP